MAKKIKMLKPGTFKSMGGKVVNLTAEHLEATAAAYDPAVYACPLVVGHPSVDSPSYGKLAAVDFTAPFLNGEPGQIAPAFVKVVNDGYYDHVSLSLFEPDSPSNPKPGVYYPRHLGFLGAAAPAVPGLGTVNFAEEAGVVSLSIPLDSVAFGSYADTVLVRVLRNIKNTLIGEWGKEKADAAIDEWDLQMLTEEAARPDPPVEISPEPAFAEQQRGGPMDPKVKEEMDRREVDLVKREGALRQQENARKHGDNVAFAETLVRDGKRPAADKVAIVAALDFAAGITAGDTIEFGEGNAKKTQAPLDIFKGLLASGPKVIEFGELGGGELSAEQSGKAIPADLAKHV